MCVRSYMHVYTNLYVQTYVHQRLYALCECTRPTYSYCKYRFSQYIVTSFHTVQYSINTGVVLYSATAIFLCYLHVHAVATINVVQRTCNYICTYLCGIAAWLIQYSIIRITDLWTYNLTS